jgi:hypothetical protein
MELNDDTALRMVELELLIGCATELDEPSWFTKKIPEHLNWLALPDLKWDYVQQM